MAEDMLVTSGTCLMNLAQRSIGKFEFVMKHLCDIQKKLSFHVTSVFMSDVLVNILQQMQSEHLRESVDSHLYCL